MESSTENKIITINDVRAELPGMRGLIEKAASSIIDQESYESADALLVKVKQYRKRVDEAFAKPLLKAREALESVRDLKKQVDTPLSHSESKLKSSMVQYYAEAEKKRRAEEARLLAEAKKKEDEARLAEAAELEKAGEPDAAQAILEEPAPTPAVNLQKTKAHGTHMTEHWSGSVVNLRQLVGAVAQGKADISLLQANEKVINKLAGALKGRMQIPGVRVSMRYVPATRTKIQSE